MITVVDSGAANLTSVTAALARLGAEFQVTDQAALIASADRVILPGVGAAASVMGGLGNKGLVEVIKGLTCPVLGICLGMQILYDSSAEGDVACLGLIPGRVSLMTASPDTPVPHMGWNEISPTRSDCALMRGIADGAFVYFVHSYAVPCGAHTAWQSTYGTPFTAVTEARNFFGCQFHPERSGPVGQSVIRNFLEL